MTEPVTWLQTAMLAHRERKGDRHGTITNMQNTSARLTTFRPAAGAVLVISLLAACSSDDDDGGATLEDMPGVAEANLDGRWQSDCEPDDQQGAEQDLLVIAGNNVILTTISYIDTACQSAFDEISTEGRFNVSGQRTISNGEQADEIDIRFETASLRFLTDDAVAIANQQGICGRSDWELDVGMDVTDCAGGPTLPFTAYDLAYRQDDLLYIGDDSGEGDTPANRPFDVDFDRPLRRTDS